MTILSATNAPRQRQTLLAGGLAGLAAAACLWAFSGSVPAVFGENFAIGFVIVVGTFLVHELLHWFAFPRTSEAFTKRLNYWGDTDGVGVVVKGEISSARLLYVQLIPFALLTVLPLAAVGASLVDASQTVVMIIVWNAAASGYDLLLAARTVAAIRRGVRTLRADDDGLREAG